MHTYGEGWIIFPNVLSDTILSALKHIDILCFKIHQLANNFISKHTSPYGQCLHNHFGQIVGTILFQNMIKGNQNMDPYPIFHDRAWIDNQDWLSKVETSSQLMKTYCAVVTITLVVTMTYWHINFAKSTNK
jgi:hypothetical protein